MSGPARHRSAQEGSATLAALGLGLVCVLLALLVADIGVYLAGRAQAQAAADAAALAAAPVTFRAFGGGDDPAAAAASAAAGNGARLESCRCARDSGWRKRSVVVRVTVPVEMLLLGSDVATATSRATFDPTRLAR